MGLRLVPTPMGPQVTAIAEKRRLAETGGTVEKLRQLWDNGLLSDREFLEFQREAWRSYFRVAGL